MTDFSIQKEDSAAHGRYFVNIDGIEAELTYSKINDENTIIIDYTGVPKPLRGQGIGKALVAHLVKEARAGNTTIVPLCPFVRQQYQKNPEWADVMQ